MVFYVFSFISCWKGFFYQKRNTYSLKKSENKWGSDIRMESRLGRETETETER